ncbi:MAG: hypothetical protein IJ308_05970 [Clostridia bacterium]|nr:hypothetical protein [Clostridia bacterium]
MQANYERTGNERAQIELLLQMEGLAAKKAGIYSRLLIDARIAKKMEELQMRHKEREKALEELLYGKAKKEKGEGQVRGEGK